MRHGQGTSRTQNRLALEQLEARLAFTIDGLESSLEALASPTVGDTPIVSNAPPTIINAPRLTSGTEVRGRTTTVSVLGADDRGESNLRYTWQVVSQPTSNSVTFASNGTNAAKNNTLTFARPGNYSVSVNVRDSAGASTIRTLQFRVVSTLAALSLRGADGRVLSNDATVQIKDTTARFSVNALDQFGGALSSRPPVTWQRLSGPSGGTATFQSEATGAKVSFSKAGVYKLRVQSGAIVSNVTVNVGQVMRSLQLVTPDGSRVLPNQSIVVSEASQRLTVRGFDQFNQPMTSLPQVSWTTTLMPTGGRLISSISSSTATLTFNRLGNYQIRAVAGGASINFSANVIPTLTGIRAFTTANRLLSPTTAVGLAVTTAPLNAIGLDQFGAPLARQPSIVWQSTTTPPGANVTLSTAGNGATAEFSMAGIYGFRATSGGRSLNTSINVTQSLASFALAMPDGALIEPNATVDVPSSTQRLNVRGIDQFGNQMLTAPSVAWSSLSSPASSQFVGTTSGGVATLRFNQLGTYSLRASHGTHTFEVNANVIRSHGALRIQAGSSQTVSSSSTFTTSEPRETFTAVAVDQFDVPLDEQPDVTWSVVSRPEGGNATLVTDANAVTANFDRLGSYVLRAESDGGTADVTVNVSQRTASFTLASSGMTLTDSDPHVVSSNRVQLHVIAFDQYESPMAIQPTASFTILSAPTGGAASATFTAGTLAVSFNRAGLYTARVDVGGISRVITLSVEQSLSRMIAVDASGRTLASDTTVNVTTVSQALRALGLDQFGHALATQPDVVWSAVTQPAADTVALRNVDGITNAQFTRAGRYVFRATAGTQTVDMISNVVQTLSRINVTPGTPRLEYRVTQLFQARALDQFSNPMSTTPTFVWSATGGTISSSGSFTSGAVAGTFTVRAAVGSIVGSTAVTVAAPTIQTSLRDEDIAALVESFYADGRLDRTDMIEILRSAGEDNVVDATELADFRYLVSIDSGFQMPEYVRELAKDVVTDNPANLRFKGQAAGNLVAGSPASLLNNLVSKWFLGADHPTLTSSALTYQYSTGSLFTSTPSRADARQGMLGDCYLIASLVAIADRNPQAVRNLFIDNGDNTFTVRFFAGALGHHLVNGAYTAGFASGSGVADYVTVDRRLPAFSNGTLAYSGYGQSVTSATTSLWIALAEKAYAQWNETRNAGRDGTNQYASIEGGWMSNVNAQVLGYNSTNYSFSSTPKQTLVNALAAGRAVTLGTLASVNSGFVEGHAYIVTGYNAATDRFSVFNPWGNTHPAPLTWAQLQANCSMFVVTDPAGSAAVNVSNVGGSVGELLIGNWTEVVTGTVLPSTSQERSVETRFAESSSTIAMHADSTSSDVVRQSPGAMLELTIAQECDSFGHVLALADPIARLEALDLVMASLGAVAI